MNIRISAAKPGHGSSSYVIGPLVALEPLVLFAFKRRFPEYF